MRQTRSMILAGLFAALTAVGTMLRIPTPVSSFTMQMLFTAMAGILLGRNWGAASQAVYVALGIAGLPIFTTGGGVSALLQPTGGFLPGLILSAWVTGWAAERKGGSTGSIFAACLLGLAALYAVGLPWMHVILTVYLRQDWSPAQTIWSGMVIFLPWDLLKALLTALLCARIRPALRPLL